MTIQEFYQAVGGDYDKMVIQMMGGERVRKMVGVFEKSKTMGKLTAAMEAEDYEAAFREAHNLKGMCLNVGIMNLADVSSELTESLRGGPKGDFKGLYEKVIDTNDQVISLIHTID